VPPHHERACSSVGSSELTDTLIPAPTTCTAPGCKRSHHARGFCQKHYRQWQQTSKVDGHARMRRFVTSEEKRIISEQRIISELWLANTPAKEIAHKLQRSENFIKSYASRLKLQRPRQLTKQQELDLCEAQKAMAKYQAGLHPVPKTPS
jgi:hypothetical protein